MAIPPWESERSKACRFGQPNGNMPVSGWGKNAPTLLFKARLTKYLRDNPSEIDKVLRVLVGIATGNAPDGVKITAKDIVMAAREIMDRTEGKPLQSFAAAADTKVVIRGLEDDDDAEDKA